MRVTAASTNLCASPKQYEHVSLAQNYPFFSGDEDYHWICAASFEDTINAGIAFCPRFAMGPENMLAGKQLSHTQGDILVIHYAKLTRHRLTSTWHMNALDFFPVRAWRTIHIGCMGHIGYKTRIKRCHFIMRPLCWAKVPVVLWHCLLCIGRGFQPRQVTYIYP